MKPVKKPTPKKCGISLGIYTFFPPRFAATPGLLTGWKKKVSHGHVRRSQRCDIFFCTMTESQVAFFHRLSGQMALL